MSATRRHPGGRLPPVNNREKIRRNVLRWSAVLLRSALLRAISLIMNTRHLLHTVIFISALAFSLAFSATLRASPDDEITRAVSAGGARNVQQVEPRVYL